MLKLPPEVLRLAEDMNSYMPLRRGDRRLETDRYMVILAGTPGPHGTVVQRLRLDASEVSDAVAEVRAVLRHEKRLHATWEVGPSATPSDLGERLKALGLTPFWEPVTTSMVLPATALPVFSPPPGARVIRVTTLEDFRRGQELMWRCFEYMPEGDPQAAVERDFAIFQKSPHWLRYVALSDDRPVAVGDAVACEHVVVLCGGATLPEARGKGMYRMLLEARAQEAIRRNIPYLLTQAGSMSGPILARLGFFELARIQIYLDTLT